MRSTRSTSTILRRVLARAAHDADFRARVVEDGRATQADYRLSDAEWHTLFDAVERIKQQLQAEPFEAAEVDHVEAERAGAKN